MGKKSLTKSTTKKKAKKNIKKKPVEASADNAVSEQFQPENSLLNKKFDSWAPGKPWKPKPDKAYEKNFAAPPAIDAKGKEAKRIRTLLAMNFDLENAPAKDQDKSNATKKTNSKKQAAAPAKGVEKAKKKAPAKSKTNSKKKMSVKDLLGMKFESWQPEKPYTTDTIGEYEKHYAAPPAFENIDKALLLKPFDLSVPDAPRAEAPPKEDTQPEAAVEAVEAPAAEKKDEQAEKPAEKPTVPVEQLLKMKFDSWQPQTPYIPDTIGEYEKHFAAPPAFENIDKALLLKQFDLSVPDAPRAKAPQKEDIQPEHVEAEAIPVEVSKPEDGKAPVEETVSEAPIDPLKEEPGTETTEPSEDLIEQKGVIDEPETAREQAGEQPSIIQKETAKEVKMPAATEKADKTPEPRDADTGGGDGGNGGNGGNGGGDDSGLPPKPPAPKKEPLLGTGSMILVASLAIVFLILIASSIANSNRYFIQDTREGIEIWSGDFSPRGTHKIVALPGAEPPVIEKRVYTRDEAYTVAYDHFMNNARMLMEDEEVPIDMRGIRNNLEHAEKYATTRAQSNQVENHMKQLDFVMLIYRADVAAELQTQAGYERALDYLNRAAALDIDSPGRIAMLNAKKEKIQSRLAEFEAPEEIEEVEEPEDEPEEIETPDEMETDEAPQDETETK